MCLSRRRYTLVVDSHSLNFYPMQTEVTALFQVAKTEQSTIGRVLISLSFTPVVNFRRALGRLHRSFLSEYALNTASDFASTSL